jgi:cytochrome c biogenesis protein CcdA
MKPSKLMHIGSVIVGFVGVLTFIGALVGGADDLVFGVTKFDALFCSAILILIATWLQIGTIHHMMLERKGEVI